MSTKLRTSIIMGIVFVLFISFTQYICAIDEEWAYFFIEQYVVRPTEVVPIRLHGYLHEAKKIKVYYIPFTNSSHAARILDGRILDSEKQLYQEFVANVIGGSQDYITLNYMLQTDKPGYYQLEMELSDGYVVKRGITVTEIGLVVKHSSKALIISAVDLTTGDLLSGVEILVRNEQMVLKRLLTDERGVVAIEEELPPYLYITAFSPLGCAQVYSSNWYGSTDSTLYFYTDRPLYRPGHSVQFKGILRSRAEEGYLPITSLPITVQVRDAYWNYIYANDFIPNEWGSISGKFNLPIDAVPGTYTLIARFGEKYEYSYFTVSSYEKPEYEVSLKTDEDVYSVGDTITVKLFAEYFYGAPVKDGKVEYTVYASEYGTNLYNYGELITEGESQTNSEGHCIINIPTIPSERRMIYRIETVVTDSAGKVIEERTQATVYPSVISLSVNQSRYLGKRDQPIRLSIVSGDIYGNKFSLGLSITVFLEYWEENKAYRKTLSTIPIHTEENGRADYNFIPSEEGFYGVEVSCLDEKGYQVTSTAWFWIVDDTFPYWMGPKGGIEILTDSPVYQPNQTARVLLNVGLDPGPVLVSVEGTELYYWDWLEVDSGGTVIEIPIKEEYLPNVWISVVAVRGRSYFQSTQMIEVHSPEPFLQVVVTPDKHLYLPGEDAQFSIEVLDHLNRGVETELSFGLVDEAIYAIQEERVKSIEDFFYGDQYRQVMTRYSFPRGYLAGPGKDGTAEIDVRDEFEDTAIWIPHLHTDEKGHAMVTLTLPDNLTTWRATIRAHSLKTQVGQAIQNVVVNKPLMVRLGAPRFLVVGDKTEVIMIVHNNTDQERQIELGLHLSGVKLLEGEGKTVDLPAGESTQVKFLLEAIEPGEVKLTPWVLEINSTDALSDAAEYIIPVYNRGEKFSSIWMGRLLSSNNAREKISFQIPSDVNPENAHLQVSLQSSLIASLFEASDYLARYPWGCAEQIMSSFLPDIILSEALEKAGLDRPGLLLDLDEMVESGLLQLYSMQRADGSWGWWRDDKTSIYITGYVMYGMAKARQAGYQINEDAFTRGISALKELLAKAKGDELGYLSFVLAHIEKDPGMLPLLLELKNNPKQFSLHVRALLVLALEQLGARDESIELLQAVNEDLGVREDQIQWPLKRWNQVDEGKEFWVKSGIETAATILEAYLRLDPSHAHVFQIVQALLANRSGNAWYSTKETSSVLAALTSYLYHYPEELQNADGNVRINLNNQGVGEYQLDTQVKFEPIWHMKVNQGLIAGDNTLVLDRTGSGPVYYRAELEGFKEVPWVLAKDQGIKVKREYNRVQYLGMERYGQPIYSTSPLMGKVNQGEVIRVKIRITAPKELTYLMIEDPIPAGFSVIEESLKWKYWTRSEVHDDRVVFFITTASDGKVYLEYDLRAERVGEYWVRPTQAILMYETDTAGNSLEAKLIVQSQ